MRNHKILFIYPNLIGPYHQERIEAFHEIGCEPIVWEILRQPDAGYSWKIDHQHFSFRYLRFTPLSLLTTGLSNYIKLQPAQVVLHGWDCPAALLFSLWLRWIGMDVSIQGESYGKTRLRRSKWSEELKSIVLRQFSAYFAPGPAQSQYVSRLTGGRLPCFETDYMGLRLDLATQVISENTHAEFEAATRLTDGGYFLIVARLVPFKRIEIAIASYAAYTQMCSVAGVPADPLIIIGEGPHAEYLKTRSSHYGCGALICFLGFVEGRLLRLFYKHCRAFITCGHNDLYPMVVCEAIAHGAPVLATDSIGNTHLIADGETGRLCAEDGTGLPRAMFEFSTGRGLTCKLRKNTIAARDRVDAVRSARRTQKAFEWISGAKSKGVC